MSRHGGPNRHGGPKDRGAADAYYLRGFKPHFYEGATYQSPFVPREAMTPEQIEEYRQGYAEQQESGDFKVWE
jgi:hypothetical protein